MHGTKQLTPLNISEALIIKTIISLKASPDKEKVLLWLGKRTGDQYVVDEIFTPLQVTDEDYFNIPEKGMDELMSRLRTTRKMLIAQIHTHPMEAFHSFADDKWAIVRHVGAYSLVLPRFCSTTESNNFLENVATFVLSESNSWEEVDNSNLNII